MIIEYFRKVLTGPSKRLSPPEKVAYKAAENDFTSEGAPPAEISAAAAPAGVSAPTAKAAVQRADTPEDGEF